MGWGHNSFAEFVNVPEHATSLDAYGREIGGGNSQVLRNALASLVSNARPRPLETLTLPLPCLSDSSLQKHVADKVAETVHGARRMYAMRQNTGAAKIQRIRRSMPATRHQEASRGLSASRDDLNTSPDEKNGQGRLLSSVDDSAANYGAGIVFDDKYAGQQVSFPPLPTPSTRNSITNPGNLPANIPKPSTTPSASPLSKGIAGTVTAGAVGVLEAGLGAIGMLGQGLTRLRGSSEDYSTTRQRGSSGSMQTTPDLRASVNRADMMRGDMMSAGAEVEVRLLDAENMQDQLIKARYNDGEYGKPVSTVSLRLVLSVCIHSGAQPLLITLTEDGNPDHASHSGHSDNNSGKEGEIFEVEIIVNDVAPRGGALAVQSSILSTLTTANSTNSTPTLTAKLPPGQSVAGGASGTGNRREYPCVTVPDTIWRRGRPSIHTDALTAAAYSIQSHMNSPIYGESINAALNVARGVPCSSCAIAPSAAYVASTIQELDALELALTTSSVAGAHAHRQTTTKKTSTPSHASTCPYCTDVCACDFLIPSVPLREVLGEYRVVPASSDSKAGMTSQDNTSASSERHVSAVCVSEAVWIGDVAKSATVKTTANLVAARKSDAQALQHPSDSGVSADMFTGSVLPYRLEIFADPKLFSLVEEREERHEPIKTILEDALDELLLMQREEFDDSSLFSWGVDHGTGELASGICAKGSDSGSGRIPGCEWSLQSCRGRNCCDRETSDDCALSNTQTRQETGAHPSSTATTEEDLYGWKLCVSPDTISRPSIEHEDALEEVRSGDYVAREASVNCAWMWQFEETEEEKQTEIISANRDSTSGTVAMSPVVTTARPNGGSTPSTPNTNNNDTNPGTVIHTQKPSSTSANAVSAPNKDSGRPEERPTEDKDKGSAWGLLKRGFDKIIKIQPLPLGKGL